MSNFNFVQVNAFQPNVNGWNQINKITSWEQPDSKTILLTNSDSRVIQVSFLSPSAFRVRFNPNPSPDYSRNVSYAVVNYSLATVKPTVTELTGQGDNYHGNTLLVDTGVLQVYIGLEPYGIAVYKDGQLIHQDCYGKNIVYSNSAVANLKTAPSQEQYFGFGEKAGNQLNKKSFTMTFFNYDNFTYNDLTYSGGQVVPAGNQGGPLNPSGPLYNSMPFVLAVGTSGAGGPVQYSYGLFLDNVSQTYFNMGADDYSDMDGKYYFGALYGELDYYVLVGTENSSSANVVADVLNQYTVLTGRAAFPPKYAFGYQQGCYGYYDEKKLTAAAQSFRDAKVPIDGLHIDVDFQNNYRTFTISPNKFPNPKEMFDALHAQGFKCSTNITGIISGNPMDENGSYDTPYPTRDSLINLNTQDCTLSTYKADAPVQPFIYNTRFQSGEASDLFLANESYGVNNGVNINPYNYPTPKFPQGNEQLGTYGFYCDMGRPDVQDWWGKQYDYLLRQGLDMIWQDMTDPAVVPNEDNDCDDKTLPLDLMMYDKVTGQYQPNAAVHNTFAINLIQATYKGITKLKSSDSYQGLYNYKKRNFIIARGGYAGVHRYAGIWTGDSASSWDFLSINIPEVLNAGLSGQPVSGCDIGGFANGPGSVNIDINNQYAQNITDPELFTRWMNCGAFLPWYRNHYDGYTKSFQEPYAYGDPVLSNCRKYIEIRYKLIQLFYDAMYECTQTGMPVARALFLNDPGDAQVFQHLNDQFFVGKDLLVAPVVTQGTTQRTVYLPAGSNWYVFDDQGGALGSFAPGGVTYTWYVPLGLVPLYVREGAILPLRQLEQYVGELPQNPINFTIYPGKDSSYQLYQDDEVSTNFQESGAYRVTQITTTTTETGRQISFNRTVDKYTPKESFFYVSLLGAEGKPGSVKAGGAVLPPLSSAAALQASQVDAFFYDEVAFQVVVKIFDNSPNIIVEVA
ncbi:TIM-barrel domain-containing protein [Paraflavisolibacter sp. H34]|uniref:glycoside hydrolase family 31 protein n=1 Tax=Huijunlia imazamoxiresistens TaxID=3127457 RepID=UPI003017AD2A